MSRVDDILEAIDRLPTQEFRRVGMPGWTAMPLPAGLIFYSKKPKLSGICFSLSAPILPNGIRHNRALGYYSVDWHEVLRRRARYREAPDRQRSLHPEP